MSRNFGVKCINPTATLTRDKVYNAELLIENRYGDFRSTNSFANATHVNITNNTGKAVRVSIARFEPASV